VWKNKIKLERCYWGFDEQLNMESKLEIENKEIEGNQEIPETC
jgi:hypothetical protein